MAVLLSSTSFAKEPSSLKEASSEAEKLLFPGAPCDQRPIILTLAFEGVPSFLKLSFKEAACEPCAFWIVCNKPPKPVAAWAA